MKKIIIFTLLIIPFLCGTALSENKLSKHDKYEVYDVEVVKKISLPRSYHEGLYFDGKNIWVSNGEGDNTWIVDVETGDIVRDVVPVGSFTEGLAKADNGTYWMTDWDEKKLYRVKIEQGLMSSDYDIDLEPSRPTGVVWTGEKLYVITWTRGFGTKYHLMELTDDERLKVKMRIRGIHEPSQLAWDGKYLWISSWYNSKVYKVDVNTYKVLGSFNSPAKETTGITWDGEHLWVTGTHADLYKLRFK